jgi:hypothetical protein
VGAKVPDYVLEDLKSHGFDPRVRTWAIKQIFDGEGDTLSLSPYFWQIWEPGSFREKITLLGKLLAPSPETVSQKYPVPFGSPRNYLYYMVRLKDHFVLYTRATRRILNRDQEMAILIKRQNRNINMREWLASN